MLLCLLLISSFLPPSLPPFLPSSVEHGQYQQAIELGEKYEDFQLLVQLCERAGDRERLRNYMTRFASQVRSSMASKSGTD